MWTTSKDCCRFIEITLLIVVVIQLTHADDVTKKDYCVIGAGPGGLQLGYFLEKSSRDYLVFERNGVPGSFYVKYPRHRKLISINKRHTGKSNKEFNLRHDWNSLLSDNEDLLFTKYSKKYFPDSDDLLKYLKDYQEKLNIKVQYNTTVKNLRQEKEDSECRFRMEDQNEKSYCCKVVIVSTGLDKPIIPKVKGSQYMEGYEDMDITPESFEGQSVIIIGRGNSGLELANSIYGHAAYVHLVARDRVKFSWETHYVGDIRGVNNEIFDAYMLKSLDGIFEAGTDEMYITKRSDGKLLLRSNSKIFTNETS